MTIRHCGATLGLILLASAFAGPARAQIPEPVAPRTTEELRAALVNLAPDSKLTGQVLSNFKAFALATAKEKLAKEAPEDFWTWLDANPIIRDGLVVALYPDDPAGPVQRLEELRAKFAADVKSHPHLALAFALFFGRAPADSPWGPEGVRYLRKDREAPTMEASFQYYLQYEKAMHCSLRKTPWPLLMFLADNETPIAERLWVLASYEKIPADRLTRIYYDVNYDLGALTGHPRIAELPRTLANIMQYGGTPTDRAYYASRVYKSLGLPALSVKETTAGVLYDWVAWIGPAKDRPVDLDACARGDVGQAWCPETRTALLDREVQLMAAAVGASYDEYLNARIACCVYEMAPADQRKGRVRLLREATTRNPYCAKPWRLVAAACADGTIPPAEAETVVESIFKALGAFPDLTFEVLSQTLAPRLVVAEPPPSKSEIDRNLQALDRAFTVYDKARRPDLLVNLLLLKGPYLEALGRKDAALKLYLAGSETYTNQRAGFTNLFDQALALLDGPDSLERRLAFCSALIKKVPLRRNLFGQPDASYVHVAKACIKVFDEAGMTDEARKLEASLAPVKR